MFDMIMASVLVKFPGTSQFVVQAKLNEFIEAHMTNGVESVLTPVSGDFTDDYTLLLPDNLMNIEMMYVGATKMSPVGPDKFYQNMMRRDEYHVSASATAYRKEIKFQYAIKNSLSQTPVKIICTVYASAATTLPPRYKLAGLYYVLHAIAIDNEDVRAHIYHDKYMKEYGKLVDLAVSNINMNLGDDL